MPSKIMLIRHAEKPTANPPPHGVNLQGDHDEKALSVRGWMRAGALAVLFAPANHSFQNPALATPNVIYATSAPDDQSSARPVQTILPLVEKLGANVHTNFTCPKGQEREMIASALKEDGVILICWEHNHIPDAAQHIPLSVNNRARVPDKWDDARFDLIWVFDTDEQGEGYIFSQVSEMVLAGDSPTPQD